MLDHADGRVGEVALALGAGCDRSGSSGKQLNLFAQTEYVPDEVIQGFTKETGIKINLETFSTNEQMLSKLEAGKLEMVVGAVVQRFTSLYQRVSALFSKPNSR